MTWLISNHEHIVIKTNRLLLPNLQHLLMWTICKQGFSHIFTQVCPWLLYFKLLYWISQAGQCGWNVQRGAKKLYLVKLTETCSILSELCDLTAWHRETENPRRSMTRSKLDSIWPCEFTSREERTACKKSTASCTTAFVFEKKNC